MTQVPLHPTKTIMEVRLELKLAKKTIRDIKTKHVEYQKKYLERKQRRSTKTMTMTKNPTSPPHSSN
jgi:hypothetical protein